MDSAKTVQIIKASRSSDDENLKVAAYCRVSTDSEDQINSFMAQMHYYYSFIQQSENMELVDIYADEGITGTCVFKRDEFNRMIKDSKAGKIDRIYVKSVSRFARNALDCLENIRMLKEYGVSVFFENDGIDTESLNSDLILYIKSAFAQEEAMSTSKRVSMANRMRLENGRYTFGTAPFGYKKENNMLIPIPEEAEIVVRIFKEYHAGKGMGKIAAELNTEPNALGKPWTKEGIRYILSNEKYIGDSMFQKSFTPHQLPFKSRINRGEVEKYYVHNTHEAVLENELFEAVQKMICHNNEMKKTESKVSKHSFSSKIYCSDCGWAYKRKMNGDAAYWVCSGDGIAGRRCNTKPISEEAFCRTFVNFYNRLRLHENLILRNAITRLGEIKKIITCMDSKVADIDREIGELVERMNLYAALNEQKAMDALSYEEVCEKNSREMSKLRRRRLKLLNEDEDERSIDEIRRLREKLTEAPMAILEFNHSLFDMIVEKAILEQNDRLTYVMKCGLELREAISWN